MCTSLYRFLHTGCLFEYVLPIFNSQNGLWIATNLNLHLWKLLIGCISFSFSVLKSRRGNENNSKVGSQMCLSYLHYLNQLHHLYNLDNLYHLYYLYHLYHRNISPTYFVRYHGLSLFIINYHWLSWIIMDYYGLLWIIIDYHWLSLIIIDYHWLSVIIIDYH